MSNSEKKYYIISDGAQQGPYSVEDLAGKAGFTPQTRVFVIGGGPEFMNASEVAELEPLFRAKPRQEEKKPTPAQTPSQSTTERIRREAEAERRRREAERMRAQGAGQPIAGFGPAAGPAAPPTPPTPPQATEEAEWYTVRDGRAVGPFTLSDLKAQVVDPEQLVCRKGETTWQKASETPELGGNAASGLPELPKEPEVVPQDPVEPQYTTYGQEEPQPYDTTYNTYSEAQKRGKSYRAIARIGFFFWVLASGALLFASNYADFVDEIYYFCGLQEMELSLIVCPWILITAIPAIASLVLSSKAKQADVDGFPDRSLRYGGLATGFGWAMICSSLAIIGSAAVFLEHAGVF